MSDLDNMKLDTRVPGEGGDAFILGVGKHAVEIASVKLTEQMNFDQTEKVNVIQFTFKTLKPASAEDEDVSDDNVGKHGIISCWPRLTAYQLSMPTNGNPAALTVLLNQLFGRALTQEEAGKISIGKLVGIKGYVLVAENPKSGKAKFAGFSLPKNKAAPNPADYYRHGEAIPMSQVRLDETEKAQTQAAAQKPTPKSVAEGANPFDEGDDIPNPFLPD